jgi:hypothetical protein
MLSAASHLCISSCVNCGRPVWSFSRLAFCTASRMGVSCANRLTAERHPPGFCTPLNPWQYPSTSARHTGSILAHFPGPGFKPAMNQHLSCQQSLRAVPTVEYGRTRVVGIGRRSPHRKAATVPGVWWSALKSLCRSALPCVCRQPGRRAGSRSTETLPVGITSVSMIYAKKPQTTLLGGPDRSPNGPCPHRCVHRYLVSP